MHFEMSDIIEGQLIRLKEKEKPASTLLYRMAVFSAAIVFSVGACQVQVLECGLESGPPSSKNQSEAAVKQAAEKNWSKCLGLPGVPNLHKVSEHLYRGAQPSAEGMRQLEKLGIKTVINLRFILSDRDRIEGTGLDYEHINMTTCSPRTKDVVRFLQIVTDSDRTPVFVHCRHGIDRTGMLCAVYHIVVEGWDKDEAIEEMTEGSFAFHSVQKNLVGYVRKLDIDEIKHKLFLNK
jgi:protein tyrosine phosphatase (PTP) superfamily phosphohydrolase (DUF442 family)